MLEAATSEDLIMGDKELEGLIERTIDRVETCICGRLPTLVDYQKAGQAVREAIECAIRGGWKPEDLRGSTE